MNRRQSNIRPVRGITADTVRGLLNLRHAGSDCAYLPLERVRLVDEVKGSAPPPVFDQRDAPACMRDDCDAIPARPVGANLARSFASKTIQASNGINGRKGRFIIGEAAHFPPAAEPVPTDLDDAERAYDAALDEERAVGREHDGAGNAGADQGGRSASVVGINGTPRGVSRPARPAVAARIAAAAAERIAADPELKRSRAEIIREIAQKLAFERHPGARPLPGPRIQRAVARSRAPDFVANRQALLAQAIAYLKARCILVDVNERTAAIRKYRVSGKRESLLAEEVIEHARALGMEIAQP